MISDIAAVAEVGKTYLGKVVRIADFGAFVEIFPGTDGLLHISEISENRVKTVRDELNEGDQILVKVLAPRGNKIKLSRRAVLREQREKLHGATGHADSGEPASDAPPTSSPLRQPRRGACSGRRPPPRETHRGDRPHRGGDRGDADRRAPRRRPPLTRFGKIIHRQQEAAPLGAASIVAASHRRCSASARTGYRTSWNAPPASSTLGPNRIGLSEVHPQNRAHVIVRASPRR